MKAIWNGEVIAESDNTVIVEGNHYFPLESIDKKYFKSSTKNSLCPWKGMASYYNIVVDGEENRDSAWYYPKPSNAAVQIKDHVAFWRGVRVVESNGD
ncbi:MAG: DUF427 domain-containing protein [Anaerolineales bacterium]|nr:DUF427 domain-containing protein [Chloroflexota bacterium]MBL6982966.1 DUF427 domain-containing protein [Anaerolineales bacterium]